MADDAGGHPGPPAVRPQAALEQARTQLLAGRGPGATPQEITRHTRARPRMGAHPTGQQRDQLAERTALARGDPAALALHTADQADALGATVTALRNAIYFRDYQHARPIVVLGVWAIGLFAAWLAVSQRQLRAAAPAGPPSRGVAGVRGGRPRGVAAARCAATAPRRLAMRRPVPAAQRASRSQHQCNSPTFHMPGNTLQPICYR